MNNKKIFGLNKVCFIDKGTLCDEILDSPMTIIPIYEFIINILGKADNTSSLRIVFRMRLPAVIYQ